MYGAEHIEALEPRQMLAGEPWGPFPRMIGQDVQVQYYPQLTGKGMTIAVIDSGVDYMHPDLGGGIGPGFKIIAGYDFVHHDSIPEIDLPVAHGTGVVGILAGNPYVYNGKQYQGIVPDANIIVLKEDTSAHARDALDWVIAHREQYNIVAVNITDFYEPTLFNASLYKNEVKTLMEAGVWIAAPGGNQGATVPVSVSSPAADPNVFGTTGVDRSGNLVPYFQRDSNIDVLGPGKLVTIPWVSVPDGATDSSTITHIYTDYAEGSSWSTPHVTGTAVMLRQINPALTPAQQLDIIKRAGVPVFDSVSGLTFPRLNVARAVALGYASLGKTTPYLVRAVKLPANLEAENFDNGGEGVAYHDLTPANSGGQGRPESVDVEQNPSGGLDVGWTQAGEWMKYSAQLRTTGNFRIGAKVASLGVGGTFHVEVDGVNVTGSITIPNTGGWHTWQTITSKRVSLFAGNHVFRLVMDSNAANGYVGNFDLLALTSLVAATAKPAAILSTTATVSPFAIAAAQPDKTVLDQTFSDVLVK